VASAGKKAGNGFGWLLFWLAFIIGIVLLFMLNMDRIRNSLAETRVLEKLFNKPAEEEPVETDISDGNEVPDLPAADNPDVSPVSTGTQAVDPVVPSGGEPGNTADNTTAGGNTADAVKTVERSVYLIRVDGDGSIVPTRIRRSLPASDSPMKDALEAVIKGPQTDEDKKGLRSFIPKNVKILKAEVRGSTAYITFNEEFLINTYGIEGYAAQLRQIVWTATEFSNVKDVQILIEGKRIDYLGEGLWIGSPISREVL
jgi:spore germination protein GerM